MSDLIHYEPSHLYLQFAQVLVLVCLAESVKQIDLGMQCLKFSQHSTAGSQIDKFIKIAIGVCILV